MNVLSLFDGMSCAQIALKRLGITPNVYYASEIDPYAIKVTQKNFPNTIQLGDVMLVNPHMLKHIDFLVGGSPCQGFSFSGKKLNFDDPRSKLFFNYVWVLRECQKINPQVYFLFENVIMKKQHEDVITNYLGVSPIQIDSSLVSAQARKRKYWTNIPNVDQPTDKGILLKDIVIENAGNTLSEKELKYMLRGNKKWKQAGNCRLNKYCMLPSKKSFTITANIHKGVPYNCYFNPLNKYIVPYSKTIEILDKEVKKGKINCLGTNIQGENIYFIHGQKIKISKNKNSIIDHDILGCMTPDIVNKKQNGQRFNNGQKFYTLTARDRHGILIEGYIRKLTPLECERLQTVPDNFTSSVSNTQRYKLLGNGFTVDVIVHILKKMLQQIRVNYKYI